MPLSVRLDSKAEMAVSRLSRQSGQTRSAVVRQAIAALERQHAESSAIRPWTRLAHLVGVADSGGANLSSATGERYTTLVREKARARRAR